MPSNDQSARLWLKRLEPKLNEQMLVADKYEKYYTGDHPLPELPFRSDVASRYRAKFQDLLRKSRSNWMELVVNAEKERMRVEGFRFGEQADDKDAWKMWQANILDAESQQVHTEALKTGTAYTIVWLEGDEVRITAEDPSEVMVARDSSDPRIIRAGIKRWKDEWDGTEYATVYLPDALYKYQRTEKGGDWTQRRGVEPQIKNPLGVVPIVPFDNKPRIRHGGVSELYGLTDIQDRINVGLFGRMLAMDFAAAPQRWATGIDYEEDDNGEPLTPFEVAVDRLWTSENPDAKFGQFKESDLSGYIKSVEQDIQHLAAISRTPPHYLLGQSGAFPSGESLKSTEVGLVRKVESQCIYFGESWEQVMRLAFKATNDPRASVVDAETIWRDPESYTESQRIDAAVKKKELGVPNRQLQEDIGYSPQQIERFPELLKQEASGEMPDTVE